MITDTHCHLDTKDLLPNIEKILENAKLNRVNRFIIPAIESDNMDNIIKLVDKYDNIYFSTGNHPNRLQHYNIKNIEKYITHEKCIAVGECGLDWFRIPKDSDIIDIQNKQKKIFREQIELSIKYNKPLILHSRDTDEDMVNVLSEYKNDLKGGVVHCYVGSDKLLELQKYGFYYGIGGVSTYKSAKDLEKNLKKLTIDKIILETDSPYLTPEPFRKDKINKPEYTKVILDNLIKLKGGNLSYIENKIEENVNKLFFNY